MLCKLWVEGDDETTGIVRLGNRYSRINTGGDPSVKLNKVIDGKAFMMLSEKVDYSKWPYALS